MAFQDDDLELEHEFQTVDDEISDEEYADALGLEDSQSEDDEMADELNDLDDIEDEIIEEHKKKSKKKKNVNAREFYDNQNNQTIVPEYNSNTDIYEKNVFEIDSVNAVSQAIAVQNKELFMEPVQARNVSEIETIADATVVPLQMQADPSNLPDNLPDLKVEELCSEIDDLVPISTGDIQTDQALMYKDVVVENPSSFENSEILLKQNELGMNSFSEAISTPTSIVSERTDISLDDAVTELVTNSYASSSELEMNQDEIRQDNLKIEETDVTSSPIIDTPGVEPDDATQSVNSHIETQNNEIANGNVSEYYEAGPIAASLNADDAKSVMVSSTNEPSVSTDYELNLNFVDVSSVEVNNVPQNADNRTETQDNLIANGNVSDNTFLYEDSPISDEQMNNIEHLETIIPLEENCKSTDTVDSIITDNIVDFVIADNQAVPEMTLENDTSIQSTDNHTETRDNLITSGNEQGPIAASLNADDAKSVMVSSTNEPSVSTDYELNSKLVDISSVEVNNVPNTEPRQIQNKQENGTKLVMNVVTNATADVVQDGFSNEHVFTADPIPATENTNSMNSGIDVKNQQVSVSEKNVVNQSSLKNNAVHGGSDVLVTDVPVNVLKDNMNISNKGGATVAEIDPEVVKALAETVHDIIKEQKSKRYSTDVEVSDLHSLSKEIKAEQNKNDLGKSLQDQKDVEKTVNDKNEAQDKTSEPVADRDAKAKHEVNTLVAQTINRFKKSKNFENFAKRVGLSVKNAAKNIVESDEDVAEGSENVRKMSRPLNSAISQFGTASLVSAQKKSLIDKRNLTIKSLKIMEAAKLKPSDITALSTAGFTSESIGLMKDGFFTIGDLSETGRKDIVNKLKENGVNIFVAKNIAKNRKSIYDLIIVQSTLKQMQEDATKKGVNVFTEKELQFLNSDKMFDLRSKETQKLITKYFSRSQNEILNKINFSSFTTKDLARLENYIKEVLDEGDITLSVRDLSFVSALKEQSKLKELRIKKGQGLRNILKSVMRKCVEASKDDILSESARNLSMVSKVANSGLITYQITRGTVKLVVDIADKVPPIHRFNSYINKAKNLVKQKTVDSIRFTANGLAIPFRESGKIVKKATVNAVKSTVKKNVSQATIAEIRAKQKRASGIARAAGEKVMRTAKAIQYAATKAGSAISTVGRTITAPVRFVGKGIGKIFSFFNKIKLIVCIALFVLVAIYLFMVFLISVSSSVVNTAGGVVATTMLSYDDNLISDMVEKIADNERKRDAYAKALTQNVQDNKVLDGHTINHYGYKKSDGTWSDGFTLTYLDGAGTQIGNPKNNTKDLIVLTYLILQGDFDTDPAARDALLDDLYSIMNPEPSYEESEIYSCIAKGVTNGDEELRYACNDSVSAVGSAIYKVTTAQEIQRLLNAGVFFQAVPLTTSDGCSYLTICYGHHHDQVRTNIDVPEGADYSVKYTGGRVYTITIKDKNGKTHIEKRKINIPVGCDDYTISYTESAKSFVAYCCSHVHKNVTGSLIDGSEIRIPYGCNNYGVLNRCDTHFAHVCYGHKDIHVTEQTYSMDDIFRLNLLPDSSSPHYAMYEEKLKAFLGNTDAWNTGWTEEYKEWGHSLYSQSWEDLYGKAINGADASGISSSLEPGKGIAVRGSLSDGEIGDILANAGLNDSFSVQYRACKSALQKVGMPYSQPLRDSGKAYDCSSFCYYSYKTAGIDISYGGANTAAAEAQGLANTGILIHDTGDMQPGDLIFYSYEKNGRYKNITHVAMYIGNGMIAEAANEEIGCQYRQFRYSNAIVQIARPNK